MHRKFNSLTAWLGENNGTVTAFGTVVIAVLTGFYVYYAKVQWKAMQGQLGEMRGSGQQTDQLITLYQQQLEQLTKQAFDTHDLAVAAKHQADRTKELADRALAQAKATNDLVRQAKRSADIAANDQRPWVGVSDFRCEGCSSDADDTLKIGRITVVMTNTGKTPAVQVIEHSGMADRTLGDPTPAWDSFAKDLDRPDIQEFLRNRTPADRNADLHSSGPLPQVLAPNAPTQWILGGGGISIGRDMKTVPFNRRKIVYFLGRITYSDTAQLKQYVTTVCLMSSWTGDATLRFCDTGNDMK